MTRFLRALALLLGLLVGASCDTAFKEEIVRTVNLSNQAQVTISPRLPSLSPSTRLQVSFSKKMDPASLRLSGTLAEFAKPEWATNSVSGTMDTTILFVHPKEAWPATSHQTLVIQATDQEGYASEVSAAEYGVLADAIHVATTGNDANSGTPDQPVATLATALDRLDTLNLNWTSSPLVQVRLGAGEFPVADLMVPSTFVIEGGWSADWSAQDAVKNTTTLRALAGSTSNVLGFVDTARGTAVRDLDVVADQLKSVILFRCQNSDLELTRVKVVVTGGAGVATLATMGLGHYELSHVVVDATAGSQSSTLGDAGRAALFVGPAASGAFHLADSVIALHGTKQVSALILEGIPSLIERSRFLLDGEATNGDLNTPVGLVQNFNGDLVLRNCVLDAGDSATSCEQLVYLHGADAVVQNNTFRYRGQALSLGDRVQATIENNLLLGGGHPSAAVRLYTNDATPLALRNNAFLFADAFGPVVYNDQEGDYGSTWYVDDLAALSTYLAARNTLVSDNQGSVNDGQSSIGESGELLASVPTGLRHGGRNLSDRFGDDVSGQPRPAQGDWSIGAYRAP